MNFLINKKILAFVFVFLFILSPVLVSAQVIPNPIIPECKDDNCGFYDLILLINNVVKLLIAISFPIAAGVIAWAGFNMMMDAGNGAKRKDSIEMIKKVLIGFAIILVSWIAISTLLNALLSSSFPKEAIKIQL